MSRLTKLAALALVAMAVLLAIVALIMGRNSAPADAPVAMQAAPAYPVVSARGRLTAGAIISASDVAVVNMAVQPVGSFRDPGAVVGKVARDAIDPGVAITQDRLASGLPVALEVGQRAVAVPVDEIVGVGNSIEAGDFVDVFFSLHQGAETKKTQARLLLSRVRVLKYGADSIDKAATPSSAAAARDGARTAVLAVPVEDVDPLLLGSQNGKLTLALRHPADPGVADVALFPAPGRVLTGRSDLTPEQREQLRSPGDRAYAGLDMNALSGDASGNPAPATVAQATPSLPAAPSRRSAVRGAGGHSIEVIRGTSREDTSL